MKSIAEINAIRDKMRAERRATRVAVGMATCGLSAGARPVYDALLDEVAARGLENVEVVHTGCLGMCKLEPIVEVFRPGEERVTYVHVTAEKARDIVERHVAGGRICEEYLIANE